MHEVHASYMAECRYILVNNKIKSNEGHNKIIKRNQQIGKLQYSTTKEHLFPLRWLSISENDKNKKKKQTKKKQKKKTKKKKTNKKKKTGIHL